MQILEVLLHQDIGEIRGFQDFKKKMINGGHSLLTDSVTITRI
jgi:hypothetical protein